MGRLSPIARSQPPALNNVHFFNRIQVLCGKAHCEVRITRNILNIYPNSPKLDIFLPNLIFKDTPVTSIQPITISKHLVHAPPR